MIERVRPLLSAVPRSASGTWGLCSTIRVALSALLLFQAIHTPKAETMRAASAISSPRLIQRRRVLSSVIVRQLPAAGAALQVPSFPQYGRQHGPNRYWCPKD